MIRRFSQGFTLDAPEEVKSFLELLKIVAKPDQYQALVARTFDKPNFEARKSLLQGSSREWTSLCYCETSLQKRGQEATWCRRS